MSRARVCCLATTLSGIRTRFFALLPQPVEALELAAPAQERAGETIALDLRRVCRFDDAAFAEVCTIRPDGQSVWLLRQIVPFRRNQALARIPFAYNDPPGDWRFTAVDAATGARPRVRFTSRLSEMRPAGWVMRRARGGFAR